jgi:hypothetical protein
MAKEKKRKYELHKMIVEEAQKNSDCEGFVSIDIYKVGSLEFSWKADHPVFRGEEAKPRSCEAALLTEIIPRLQARYDFAGRLRV